MRKSTNVLERGKRKQSHILPISRRLQLHIKNNIHNHLRAHENLPSIQIHTHTPEKMDIDF